MKHLLRPDIRLGLVALLGVGAVLAPLGLAAQGGGITEVLQDPSPMLMGTSASQGYLGVDVTDVDQDKAQALKLKEVRGAVITLIDHDAPAGQIGLKVNDVVIQLNGQNVEGAEQLKRMLREIPPGRKVSLEISRDGNVQTLAVELVDHRVLGHDVWNRIGTGGDTYAQSTPSLGILSGGGGDAPVPGGFHMPFFGSTLNVGAFVEPLTTQMAEYLGVSSGLMVKQVARKSEAAAAGLKAFDVILKVGPEAVTNLAGWDRALRANQGKPVQVTILRDKKQQTLTLQVDSKHKSGEMEFEQIFPDGDGALLAEIDPDAARMFGGQDEAAAEMLRDQAEAMKDQVRGMVQAETDPQWAEELRNQAEKLRDVCPCGDLKDFKIDPKQMEELKRQMEEFSKSFKPEDFKVDPSQMEELKRQMDEWQKNFKPDQLQIAPY
jgi:serine protease Do